MKKPMIVTMEALTGEKANLFLDLIPFLSKDFCFYLYKESKRMCEIVALTRVMTNTYDKLINTFVENNCEFHELNCYSFSELIYLMKSPKFICDTFGDNYNGELYLSPSHSSNYKLICEILDFKDSVFEFVRIAGGMPIFQNIAEERSYNHNPKYILKSHDTSKIELDKCKTGDTVHYTINGKTTYDNIPKRVERGAEGITFKSGGYRVKIWTGSYQYGFVFTKLQSMIELKNKPRGVAFPIAFVYNDDEHIVGIVMENFDAEHLDIARLCTQDNSGELCVSLLSKLLSLEAIGVLPRDIKNNVMESDNSAFVIDLDSTEAFGYFATAQSNQAINTVGLPLKYKIYSKYYCQIPLSYFAMYSSISSFTMVDPDTDVSLFVEHDNGSYSLNQKRFEELSELCRHIAECTYFQYNHNFPNSYFRILLAVYRDNNNLNFVSSYAELDEYLQEIINLPNEVQEEDGGTHIFTIEKESPIENNHSVEKELPKEDKNDELRLQREPEMSYKQKVKMAKDNRNEMKRDTRAFTGFFDMMTFFLKKLIVKLFINSAETWDIDPNKKYLTQTEAMFDTLVEKKLYVKPLIITISTIAVGALAIIAALIIQGVNQ